jgi:hypothetical protein
MFDLIFMAYVKYRRYYMTDKKRHETARLMTFQVLATVSINVAVFGNVTPCSSVDIRRLGRTWCLYARGNINIVTCRGLRVT